jgi:hypothetical protein
MAWRSCIPVCIHVYVCMNVRMCACTDWPSNAAPHAATYAFSLSIYLSAMAAQWNSDPTFRYCSGQRARAPPLSRLLTACMPRPQASGPSPQSSA